jgi:hypothetical protein
MTAIAPRLTAELSGRVVGQLVAGELRIGHRGEMVATGIRPAVIRTGKSGGWSRPTAYLEGGRFEKRGERDRLIVYAFGDVAVVIQGPRFSGETTRPRTVDVRAARRMWRELA